MNEWQRQDEEIKQLTLMRQSSHALDNNVTPGSVAIVGQASSRSVEEGDPDWQLSWKPAHNPEGGAYEGVPETGTSDFRPENSLAQSISLAGSTEEVHTVYDVDFELDAARDQKAGGVVEYLGSRGLQETNSSALAHSPAPATLDDDYTNIRDQDRPDKGEQEARVSRRMVFRVGGQGAEDSDSDSSSLAAALEKAGMKQNKTVSRETNDQDEDGPGTDSASEISSNMITARAGAPELASVLKVGETKTAHGIVAAEVDRDKHGKSEGKDNEEHHHMNKTSSFAFHGKDRADVRRTRMVHWEGEGGQNSAKGEDDLESIATVINAGTYEGKAPQNTLVAKCFPMY